MRQKTKFLTVSYTFPPINPVTPATVREYLNGLLGTYGIPPYSVHVSEAGNGRVIGRAYDMDNNIFFIIAEGNKPVIAVTPHFEPTLLERKIIRNASYCPKEKALHRAFEVRLGNEIEETVRVLTPAPVTSRDYREIIEAYAWKVGVKSITLKDDSLNGEWVSTRDLALQHIPSKDRHDTVIYAWTLEETRRRKYVAVTSTVINVWWFDRPDLRLFFY